MSIGTGNWSNLWRRRQTRSLSEFEDITQPHVDALWRVAHRMTRDRDLADDITQETCLRAYRAFDRFQPGTNYKAWIFRILTNLCADHMRRKARAPFSVVDSEDGPPEIVAPAHDMPDNHLMRKNFRHDLETALDALSPDLRLVMSLSLLKELSYAEIAAIADCPVGTVRSRINRGRQQLREALADHLPDDAQTPVVISLPNAHRTTGTPS